MTIITNQEEFNKRLHRAKLDIVQGRTYSSFEDVLQAIESKKINRKELCIK